MQARAASACSPKIPNLPEVERYGHKLDSILNQVDSGQGTIGQLVKNPSLYNHTDQMISDANQLVLAVRQDPKKYLTIHLKIF